MTRALLEASFRAAVAAADPGQILAASLPAPPRGCTRVVGAGKAAASMAAALERAWPEDRPLSGTVLTRYGHACPTRRIQVVEAAHPVPDAAGARAAAAILAEVQAAGSDDQVIVLVSGGGSALLSLPAPGLDLEDLRQTTAALLQAGIPIEEMNVVRKHLSAISGGRLAAASAAPVLALIISDVTGDDPADIASGPCAADPSSFADALAIVTGHGLQLPPAVRQHLRSGAAGAIADTPKPGDPRLARVENRVIGSAQRSLEAAAAVFTQAGIAVVSLGDRITGEAREVGRVMAGIALEAARPQSAWPRPVALISGGECTVSVGAAGGRGGRNTEFLLSLAIALKGAAGIHALAADTDGIDGTEDNAGALAGPDTLERAARAGLSAKAMLARHEAYGFFAALGDLLVTGPTLTNVNDYRAILVGVRS